MARTRTAPRPTRKIKIMAKPELRDMHSIMPYPNNPRLNEHAVELVANSIRTFGFGSPIILDKKGVIINGHTRFEAAKTLGMDEVPCLVASHLTDAEVKAFRLADNKTAEAANWDFDKLAREMGVIESMGFDISQMVGMGWDQSELDCLNDVVADDCLSAGVAAGLEESARTTSAENARAPQRTRMVLGEFVFFLPTDKYRQWANEVRVEGDHVETDINRILQNRLGLAPYLSGGCDD
jgi:hypothetical protein